MQTPMSSVALIAVFTAGMVVGISFLAQPVKFMAADVPLAQQVRIGSVIFHASHGAQAALLAALSMAMAMTGQSRLLLWCAWGGALAALAVQVALLMPPLDARVAAISAGRSLSPEPSLHVGYAGLELAKVAALGALAWLAAYRVPCERLSAG
jgi:hypothetical protein